ncbi:phenylalanine--tRNA ligase subunit beta [Patescibacteria group bacterium]|nr:phenylalanine--tRNA ligase subunit beta [Patescibacteria group bacterium]
MKVSLNWLNEFIQVPKDHEKFARQITEHCFEVEKIIYPGREEYKFSNIFIARVVDYAKHPNADRLRVVKVELGAGRIVEPVVCGADNFVQGDMVALALPGAVIPQNVHSDTHETFVLQKAKIRGVESQGMICSAFELGLADEPEERPEIMILPKEAKLGQDLSVYLRQSSETKDVVFDMSLPANRADLYSHIGIAREISAILGIKPKQALIKYETLAKIKSAKRLKVAIKDAKRCPAYIGMRMKVKIKESPDFIKERLKSLGLRPVNNVVDITNYVMHEMGEPLHAFDSSKVKGRINVRMARNGEELVTIDHRRRVLSPSMLVIADDHKALAVAGIMGGADSEVSENTSEIILEAANFAPTQIRRTSKALGLRTEGSGFWEKGLAAAQAYIGSRKAFELLQKYASAELAEYSETGNFTEYDRKLVFAADEINSLLGSDFSTPQLKKYLQQLGFKATGSEKITVKVPWFRRDIGSSADIADEILKIAGMNFLEKRPLMIERAQMQVNSDSRIMDLKEFMSGCGYNEVQNYSFVSEKEIAAFGRPLASEYVSVLNPLSAEQGYLRKNLLLHLIKNASANGKNFGAFKLFEIGKSYAGFLKEPDLLTFINFDKSKSKEQLYAEAKGTLESLVSKYTSHPIKYMPSSEGQVLDFEVIGKTFGNIGMVDARTLKNFDVEYPLAFCKLEVAPFVEFAEIKKYAEFSKYPQKVLDISLIVSSRTKWSQIDEIVRRTGGQILASIDLFEAAHFYPKSVLPSFHKELSKKGLKNIAFHLIFQAKNKTLKDSEILPIYDKIIVELKSKLGAEIR